MLEWVIHDGAVVHVSAFADLPPRSRPRVTCPQCGGVVRPKLGTKVRHHVAHSPTSRCYVAGGESALHVNIKFHIANELRRVAPVDRRIVIAQRCGANGCDERRVHEWLDGWDDVHVEHRVNDTAGTRIPDIVLGRNGKSVAGIEVVATNAVSDQKASALARLGVSFIEVAADPSLIALGDSWTPTIPLPVEREGSRRRWRCDRHPDEANRKVYAARVVDLLYPNGVALRRVFRVDIVYDDSAAKCAELTCDDDLIARIAIADASDAESRRRAVEDAYAAFERDAESFREHGDAVVDSPMSWATGVFARSIVVEHEGAHGRRKLFLYSRYPRRYRYVKARAAWWMPPDMRDVRWNVETYDTLADHPVWGKVRESARARYRGKRHEEL